jgi:hypothetical protein
MRLRRARLLGMVSAIMLRQPNRFGISPMRPLFAALLLLVASPAAAQHWNDSPPGRDLLSSVPSEFDAFRQRVPVAPAFTATAPAGQVDVLGQPRDPIPILDWTTPQAAPAATPRRSTTRRVRRRAPVQQDTTRYEPAPAPVARAATPTGGADWERSLAERERELERLRQQLQQDRLRYEQARQPTLQ